MGEISLSVSEPKQLKSVFLRAWELAEKGLRAGEIVITLGRPKRSPKQNRKMWAMLRDISEQVEWYDCELEPEDWKHILTASLKKQRAVPGVDGGFVVLGLSTKKMSKKLFRDLVELIYAFGAEHNVSWTDPVEREYLAKIDRELGAASDEVSKAA